MSKIINFLFSLIKGITVILIVVCVVFWFLTTEELNTVSFLWQRMDGSIFR